MKIFPIRLLYKKRKKSSNGGFCTGNPSTAPYTKKQCVCCWAKNEVERSIFTAIMEKYPITVVRRQKPQAEPKYQFHSVFIHDDAQKIHLLMDFKFTFLSIGDKKTQRTFQNLY